jgi:ABC-type molybdate transport system permease subunit
VSVAAASFAEGDRLSSGLDAALPELVEVVAGVVAGGPMVLVNAGLVALLQARDRSDAWSSPRPRGAVVGLGETSMTAPTALADMHSADFLVLCGLIIPPAVVPTVWVLQKLGLFKTLGGLILIEVAFGLSFCILLFRAFIATIPRDLDEAAIIDGAGPVRLFFKVIFPLLKSVMVTVIIVQSVAIFNDFANPLYFLPGDENATVQLTVFNFQSQFTTQYNLLFADILLITIPPLLLFLFLNRRIVEGITAGAVKG